MSGLSCPEAGGCKSAILFFYVFSLFVLCKVGEKTRLLIVGGGRVNGESMFPGPRNGETLGEL